MLNKYFGARGFTIIETILAITVIGLVIAATAQLTQSSLRLGRTTIEKFTAFHSAEEGLEITRSVRDSNWLRNRGWRTGLDDGLYVVGEKLPWSLERIVRSDAENYERVISIESSDNALHVASTVTYLQNGESDKVVLETELTDWKKGPL